MIATALLHSSFIELTPEMNEERELIVVQFLYLM